MRKIKTLLTLSAVLSLLLVGTAFAGEGHGEKKTIVQTAQAAGSFNTLISLLESTGLDETLSGDGPFTVFAPTDAAFERVPAATLKELQADKEKLKSVLTYHVVSGKVPASKVAGLSSAKTVQGAEIKIDTADGVKVDAANVTKTDIFASNGIIHVIDSVLMPEAS